MTDAVFNEQQGAQFDALASTAWALLDAERQGNRALAASAVPVFIASWNAWGSTVRMAYHDAPASLSLAGGGWSPSHDDALKVTMAVFVQTKSGLTSAQVDQLLGILDGMPSGMPFQAFRGVWFDTSFLAALPGGAPSVFDTVDHAFITGGAAALSDASYQIAQGIAPAGPAVPSMVPAIPSQTPHPTSAQASSFVMPRSSSSTTLPDIEITGRAPAAQEAFPVGAVLAIGAVAVAGLSFGGYALWKAMR